MHKKFAKMWRLVLFILRRERVHLAAWVISLVLLNVIVALSYAELYPDKAERQAMAELVRNPAMVALIGPSSGLDDYTIGAMIGHEMLVFSAIAVGIMNILFISRQTKADEEEGRLELIRAQPVGRMSSLGGALIVAAAVNTALAVCTGIGFYACGIESMGLASSLLYGALLGALGLFFAAVAAVAAQLAQSSGGANGAAFCCLGIFYVMRAIGDVRSEALALLSPLGVILRAHVYVSDLWWPVFALMGFGFGLWGAAFILNAKRDLGSALLLPPRGRKRAPFYMQGSLGLAFRLQWAAAAAWLVALFVLGLSYGSVFGDLELVLASNEFLRELLPAAAGFSLTKQFLSMLMSIFAMTAAIPALIHLFRLLKEEKAGRLEYFLTRGVSKTRILLGFLGLGAAGGFLYLIASVLAVVLAANAVLTEPLAARIVLQAGLAQYPAILALLALGTAFIGWYPGGAKLLWPYLGFSFFSVYFGRLIKLPDWMPKASPFGLVPQAPAETYNTRNLAVLLGLIIFFAAVGWLGFCRRDLQS